MKQRRIATSVLVLAGLIAGAACGTRGDDDDATDPEDPPVTETTDAPDDTEPTSTDDDPETTDGDTPETTDADDEPSGEMFGTLESPCGPGDATIAEGQNGDDGVLRLATGNDRDNQFQQGLTQEMYDAAMAFAGWCNDQGGIQGLEIEIVDMDGKIVEAASAMEVACSRAFAMVGGGLVLDDQTFPRFHECDMIDFAGYTVTAEKALSNGMIQPIPNPPNDKPAQWTIWGAEAFPEAVENTALLYSEIATVENVKDQLREVMEETGWTVTLELSYALGEANWTPFAQRLKDEQITAMSFSGTPEELAPFLQAMDEVDYQPEFILQEANFYDSLVIERAGAAAEGIFVRTAYAPFEEADEFPGMASYLDMMETYRPNGKIAGLGLQATSAHLMFATAANMCLDDNDGVLERECVLAAGLTIDSWDAGGLHVETNPASKLPPNCGIIMEVRDGQWQRAYPELGTDDDNADGWNCRDEGMLEIPGVYGDYERGIDPDRPN